MGFAVEVGADISIHALLTESDPDFARSVFIVEYISIHALLTESDETVSQYRLYMVLFQSTLSSRRATSALLIICLAREISIHALLTESDR